MAIFTVELDESNWFSPRLVEERRMMRLREEEAERWKATMERRRVVIEAHKAEVAKKEEERHVDKRVGGRKEESLWVRVGGEGWWQCYIFYLHNVPV